ncbi:hypothetical protein L0B53_03950 [Vibrio sp. SS-MA-C1-2]|uniref:hypothetical protein n=1 Tax=Vibrio sp. SS-MA-C1-2 TaxID=2908646 RepID=UPI001F3CD1CB|nr:hypothetical protein [Vibrio sp. SS-MA-C1-2]UJF17086.1 hypothetical protein L0B53_03950 [Vibrio sp. SS-MA-C1-2]
MLLPTLQADAPDGVSVLLSEPVLSEDYKRGEHFAEIIQVISYSIDRPGHYQLGGEKLTWWDPIKQRSS